MSGTMIWEAGGSILESTGAFLVLQLSKKNFEKLKGMMSKDEKELVYYCTDERKREDRRPSGTRYWMDIRGYLVDGSEQILFKTVLDSFEHDGTGKRITRNEH